MHGLGELFRRHPALLRLALLALLAELGYAIIVPTLPLYLSEALKAPENASDTIPMASILIVSNGVRPPLLALAALAMGNFLCRRSLHRSKT